MSAIMANGNFSKLMFLLLAIFFGAIIAWQLYKGKTDYIDELLTALLVFFALTGRTITEIYKQKAIGKSVEDENN